MRPVSAAFLEAVRHSHQIAVRVEILENGAVVRTVDSVIGGSVTLDATAKIRGRCDVAIVDDDLIPSRPQDLLTPYGNELRVWRGIRYPDGEEELVSVGVFGIRDVTVDRDGQIRVEGLDRAAKVAEARLEQVHVVPVGTDYVTAIRDLIVAGVPTTTFAFPPSSRTTPLLVFEEGDDRWERAVEMATSLGMSIYFDGDGVCTMRPEVTVESVPVFEMVDGADGVLIDIGKEWSRENVYNRVIATGENSSLTEPVRAVATDNDPTSPTYYEGKYGRRPRFYSSQYIYTVEQAQDAADGMLARQAGLTQQVRFGAVVNPALEPGDVVAVRRHAIGVSLEAHVLDSLTIPLAA